MTKYIYKTKPRKYQVEAIKFLIKNKGVGALLMDPGTGKTKVMIDYLGITYGRQGSLNVLVSAPLSALDTWVDEVRKHLGTLERGGKTEDIPTRIFVLNAGSILDKSKFISELDFDFEGITVVVVNHDAFKYQHKVPGLKTVTVRDRIIKAVAETWSPDIVIVDEMHRLKTHTSNLSSAFKKIGKSAFQRVGLTGTVAPHSPLDFFGQWQFINPRRFGESWQSFRYYYAIYGGYEGKQVIGFYGDRLKEMKEKISKDSFIIKKRDVLDLPKVTHVKVPVHLTTELKYYKEMGKEYISELPSGKMSISRNTLTKILRLRQITGGVLGYREYLFNEDGSPILDSKGLPKEVSKTEDIGSSKLDTMMDKVETLVSAGKKQVIFAHFRRDVVRIVEECHKKFPDIPVYHIIGSTKGSSRLRQRKAFFHDEKPSIFVAQMRTVSLAINEFVVASYGHFYSYSQLRDDFIQAIDRLDRPGQQEPVTLYHYIVPHSIDAVILDSHREKGKLEAQVTRRAREILTLGEEQ